MAGATAFFTTFALPPILVILIQFLKIIFGTRGIRRELLDSLSDILGPESVRQLAEVLRAFRKLAQNGYATAAGFIFLVFVATTLFSVIKRSLNQVWKISPQAGKGFLKGLRNRFFIRAGNYYCGPVICVWSFDRNPAGLYRQIYF